VPTWVAEPPAIILSLPSGAEPEKNGGFGPDAFPAFASAVPPPPRPPFEAAGQDSGLLIREPLLYIGLCVFFSRF